MLAITPTQEQGYTAPPPATELPEQDNSEQQSFFDFSQAKQRITNLIQQWQSEIAATNTRRAMRNVDIDLVQLYKEGKLKQDETFIPIRVIDSNIKREQPNFVSFLTQSRRLAIFSCIDDPSLNTDLIEQAFTKGMMYNGWQLPFYKCIDGAQTHGWDSVEIEYRDDRPLKVNIDHVGHENLLFGREARSLDACELILRRYELSAAQIKRFVKKFGWNPVESAKTYMRTDSAKDFANIVIYKGMFKWEGIVYVFWTSEKETSDWIKAPEPLNLGRETTEEYTDFQSTLSPNGGMMDIPTRQTRQVPVYESQYPFKLLCYSETEQQAICEYKGRCFYDSSKQEAQTALWSVLINGSVRASNVYGSPKNALSTGAPIKKLDLDLEHGCLYSEPVEFWSTAYPNPDIVRVSDGLETRTQIETGQPAFAVNNREDSRKTATENQIAQQQQSMLSSVGITLFSVFLQSVFSHSWLITQSQALSNNIAFLQIEQQQPSPMMGMPPSVVKMNDVATISRVYDIRSAGDIDVTQRAEKLNRRMQIWPIISTTPLAMTFLGDILKESFPEDAARYEQVMMQQVQQQNMVGQLGNVIQHMALGDDGQVKPEFKQYEPQLQALKQQLTGGQQPAPQ